MDANLRAVMAPAEAVNGRTFKVDWGDRISVNRLWTEIREHTGAQVDAEHGPARPGDVRESLADVAPLTEATGWTPSVDLREGLGRTVAWYEGALDEARV